MKPINQILLIIGVLILTSCCKDNDPVITDAVATSAQFYKSSFSLAIGGREKVMLVTEPEKAVVINAEWNSSDTTIAKVDTLGIVTAMAAGEATISLTAGNSISGECTVEVIESPIKSLVMPDAKYPIAKDGIMFIQGTGFTENSKIILRRHTNFKSTNGGSDILAQIREQALNYISFSVNVNPGSYNVVLVENSKEFDFGNIEVEIPNLPKYEYDKKKIFWEDTHWRFFQLRGKVKVIDITNKEWYTFNGETKMSASSKHKLYNFNINGRLTNELSYLYNNASLSTNIYIEFKYEYDSENRLVKLTRIDDNVPYYSTEFEYGNHNLYYPLNLHFFPPIDNLQGYGYNDYRECWIKGITKITDISYKWKTNNTLLFTIGKNTIDTEYKTSDYINKGNFSYNTNSYFPLSSSVVGKGIVSSIWDDSRSESYEFSNTGIPLSIKTLYNAQTSYLNSIENSPFYLNSDDVSGKYQYDANWNISKIIHGSACLTYYYTSYDVYGNWTECTFIMKYNDEETASNIYRITRDITYW